MFSIESLEAQWRWFPLLVTLLFTHHLTTSYSTHYSDEPVSRIAFGSCSNQSAPQRIWKAINEFDPQVFIWMGDNIYGDNRRPYRLFGKERTIGPWKNVPRFYPSSESELESRYNKTKNHPGYSHIRNHSTVIGTWDDHDYGLNDAGKEFPNKDVNQKLLLDFLDEPMDSPRRKQAGVYTSYTFGPVGRQVKYVYWKHDWPVTKVMREWSYQNSERPSICSPKVILLDTRYHRDPLSSDGTILGSAQWTWLEKQLHSPPTAITIIGSSIQVISNLSAVTTPFFSIEGWGRFPKERNRLFQMISDTKRSGVIFISGDVHYGEITRYDCSSGYPLYDITSSGLTQSVEGVVPSPLRLLLRLMAWLTPTTMRVKVHNCRYKSCTYGQPNFGVIQIFWGSNPLTLKIEVRDINGSPVMSKDIILSDLQPGNIKLDKAAKQKHCTLEVDLPWFVRYRLCFLAVCALSVLLVALSGLVFATVVISKQCLCKCKHD